MTHRAPAIRALNDRARGAIAECQRIAAMSEEPDRITRRFLTPPVHDVHALLRGRMESLGMTVHTDAAGNLRGLWQPAGARGKRLILGSHIDTVPNAGAFDGVLGVVLALEWAELVQELKLPLPIEIIAFSEEEGVRFGVPFIGSRAAAGRFDPALLALKDANGITLEAAIRAFGLDPGRIGEVEALNKRGVPLSVIGEVRQGRGVRLMEKGKEKKVVVKGYEHFGERMA